MTTQVRVSVHNDRLVFTLSFKRVRSSQQLPDTSLPLWSALISLQTSSPKSSPTRLARSLFWSKPKMLCSLFLLCDSVLTVCVLCFRSVYLHNNKLTDAGLPESMFNGSDNLEILIMSSNFLRYVPKGLPTALYRLHLKVRPLRSSLNEEFTQKQLFGHVVRNHLLSSMKHRHAL